MLDLHPRVKKGKKSDWKLWNPYQKADTRAGSSRANGPYLIIVRSFHWRAGCSDADTWGSFASRYIALINNRPLARCDLVDRRSVAIWLVDRCIPIYMSHTESAHVVQLIELVPYRGGRLCPRPSRVNIEFKGLSREMRRGRDTMKYENEIRRTRWQSLRIAARTGWVMVILTEII